MNDAHGRGNAGSRPATEGGDTATEDSVDRHIARWRDKAPFDERVEGIITRIQLINRHIRQTKNRALAEVGLQDFEFETLHRLASRGTPGRATPSELAAELKISPAGMTGRLDTLEKAGLIRRLRESADRRRIDIELTDTGRERWLAAMNLRAVAETDMLTPFSLEDQDELSGLLKRMLKHVEGDAEPPVP
ncbi:MarR family winged helix-turn-helix transcriptional regulator [Yinghuangia seranimata]|uniref:MarR family winged helix-turn-helix transcriptional regulator n=1 Tax=Yinghuangia seranimata TaxID=408067 RepID=UPI00248B3541|nr:MarR family winged helix-turn-helix transcriptional regulator [Yinghuangia seranimata]MDI2128288.1 MarR family winged helix-turn-helix transcriptional regulator [Yinghuangia seranimata]